MPRRLAALLIALAAGSAHAQWGGWGYGSYSAYASTGVATSGFHSTAVLGNGPRAYSGFWRGYGPSFYDSFYVSYPDRGPTKAERYERARDKGKDLLQAGKTKRAVRQLRDAAQRARRFFGDSSRQVEEADHLLQVARARLHGRPEPAAPGGTLRIRRDDLRGSGDDALARGDHAAAVSYYARALTRAHKSRPNSSETRTLNALLTVAQRGLQQSTTTDGLALGGDTMIAD